MSPKGLILLTALSVGTLLQSIAQEYPFIYYTPKDGLINSRVRNVYQDSKGRLFFMTANGLSIYDGARFSNYSPDDGLPNPMVNDVLEITPDSFLIATNTYRLNAWVKGKIKTIPIPGFCPVVNKMIRARDGIIYAATDQGIYLLDGLSFTKIDIHAKRRLTDPIAFDDIQEIGDKLLVKVIPEMTTDYGLYLLDKTKNELIPFHRGAVNSVIQVPNANILMLSADNTLHVYDLTAAKSSIVTHVTLPLLYQPLLKISGSRLIIDRRENVWCLNLNSILKISPDGNAIIFDKTTGLSVNNLNGVFVDRENVLWIHTDGSGLLKLSSGNVEIVTGLFSKSATGISAIYANLDSDTTWLFNREDSSLYSSSIKGVTRYALHPALMAGHILKAKDQFYILGSDRIYAASLDKNRKQSFTVKLLSQLEEGSHSNIHRAIEYKGYLLTPGPDVSVFKNGRRIFTQKIPFYTDQIIVDQKDRMWVAPRSGDLLCYTVHTDQRSSFLKFYHNYKAVVPDLNSRSITVDTNNRIWVGTRYDGVYCFEIEDTALKSMHHFKVKDGLTDNFIYSIACDKNNNIWVATQSGLDKISMENGQFIIEGVTRNNNIFQFIQAIAIPKTNQVWTLGNSGSLLRIANTPASKEYKPQLQISLMKVNDSVVYMPRNDLTFSYFQNNITFEVAAPSFIDEHQVKFSYLLEGSDNNQWSAPSPQATLNFINLPHGKYTLKIRAFFPVSSYASQDMSYSFIITPPWWDTWWSKILMAAIFIGAVVLAIRFYYQRKLEKQRILFEKQQAVEQERTRIAMEMHDDLGSGLTTIRYLAGGLTLQSGDSSKEKAEKIATSAKSLVDNMNDIIWSMKSDNNTLSEALAYIRKQAAEQLETAGIDYHIDFPKDLPVIILSNELKRNLLLISKEAIHNIVKHSAATNVRLSAQLDTGRLQLRITDNGKGINLAEISNFGNGMKSMRKRAEEIKALLEVMNAKGTTIAVTTAV